MASSAVVRRSLLSHVGYFSEVPLLKALEDYDLWLRLASVSRIHYLDEPLIIYHDEPTTSIRSQQSLTSHWQGMLLILSRLRKYLAESGCSDPIIHKSIAQRAFICQSALCQAYWNEGHYVDTFKCYLGVWLQHPFRATKAWLRAIAENRLQVFSKMFQHRAGFSHTVGRTSSNQIEDERSGKRLKLHLGCGEVYLPGYVNIDLPQTECTVQQNRKADLYADITKLSYPSCSLDEVRLHHVFEHFDRVMALHLLMEWYDWLKEGGKLVIETPDLERSLQAFLRTKDSVVQQRILRHLCGSHEAPWAIHCDMWYRAKFENVLRALGYSDLAFSLSEWHGTHNITATATKLSPFKRREQQIEACKEILRQNLVDDSASESGVRWI